MQLQQRSFCAVGEIGIDLYWDKTYLKEQQEAFTPADRMGKAIRVTHCDSLSGSL